MEINLIRRINLAKQNLIDARKVKNDEFYTVYDYIQKEMNAYLEYNPDVFRDKIILLPCDDPEWSNFTKFFAQNFERFGLKKLISTSYSLENKESKYGNYNQISFFDLESEKIDDKKEYENGKIFTLTRDINKSGNIDYDDLEWDYLDGDGDFRSHEVTKLRDEADIIIKNPPFSLFREFIGWVFEAEKDLVIIGTQNAITYKEIFPLIKQNKLWLGATANNEDMVFAVPEGAKVAPKDKEKAEKLGYKGNYTRLGNACWYTNLDHGRRHEPLSLMSSKDNLKFNKKLISLLEREFQSQDYIKYDNYDAFEVPYVDAIPSDYKGVMGVPITFLAKYNPEQFEIVGLGNSRENFKPNKDYKKPIKYLKNGKTASGGAINMVLVYYIKNKPINKVYYTSENADGFLLAPFARILIKRKEQ